MGFPAAELVRVCWLVPIVSIPDRALWVFRPYADWLSAEWWWVSIPDRALWVFRRYVFEVVITAPSFNP